MAASTSASTPPPTTTSRARRSSRCRSSSMPVTKAVTAHVNIAVAVGWHMTRRGRGVILVMAGGREAIPRLGGSHVAWAALAGLCRQFAAEFGPDGVRVSWLLSPGSPGYDEHDQPQDGAGPGEAPGEPAPASEPRRPRPEPRARPAPRACWPGTCPATTRSPTSPSSPRPTGPEPSPRARSTSPAARSWTEPVMPARTARRA